jgi:hypothetical protein
MPSLTSLPTVTCLNASSRKVKANHFSGCGRNETPREPRHVDATLSPSDAGRLAEDTPGLFTALQSRRKYCAERKARRSRPWFPR